MKRRILRSAVDITILVGVFWAIGKWQTHELVAEGKPVPGFRLQTLDGKTISSDDLRGKRTLLHFWATWCGVCQGEPRALEAVQRGASSEEVVLTVVADGGDREAVRRFVTEHGVGYPVLLGGDDVIARFHVTMFPTNYYIDPEGRIADHTVGMSTRWAMGARLAMAR